MAKCGTRGMFKFGGDNCLLPGCGEPKSSHQVNQRRDLSAPIGPPDPWKSQVRYTGNPIVTYPRATHRREEL